MRYNVTAHPDDFQNALYLLMCVWTEVIKWTPPFDLLDQTYGFEEIFCPMTVEVDLEVAA